MLLRVVDPVAQGVSAIVNCLAEVVVLPLHKELENKIRCHIARRLGALAHEKLNFSVAPSPFTYRGAGLKSSSFGSGQQFAGSAAYFWFW